MLSKSLTIGGLVTLMLSVGFGPVVRDDKIGTGRTRAGFLQIFNGKDLTGWDGDERFWSVRNGAIVAQVEPGVRVKNHSYLIWQGGKVRDFELRLKVRSTQGNSGIDYRAEPVAMDRTGQQLRWTIRGYQSDIAKGWMGSLYNWGKPGAQPSQFVVVDSKQASGKRVWSVADRQALDEVDYYRSSEWNQYTIVARGSHIIHRVNGWPVVEFIDNGRDARRQGLLGLQVHTGQGPFLNEFKDIYIKQFNINFDQAKLLFNGQDLNGWAFFGARTKNAWSVENGVLVDKGSSRGWICTDDSYTNYVLRFQYRRLREQESGLLLCLTAAEEPQPRGIRISGKGDDFNQVQGMADFELKLVRHRDTARFRRMPEKFWNECEIMLNKGQLKVKVNSMVRATAVGCKQIPGKIGFEASSSGVEYRNIVLIPILSK
ncbi:MAG: DUF1080 domain-containing protein [Sedimentisphaerales bacterium]